MQQEKYSLTWQNYSDHLRSMMEELMMNEDFSDLTLVTEDKKHIKANTHILSTCSPFLKYILKKERFFNLWVLDTVWDGADPDRSLNKNWMWQWPCSKKNRIKSEAGSAQSSRIQIRNSIWRNLAKSIRWGVFRSRWDKSGANPFTGTDVLSFLSLYSAKVLTIFGLNHHTSLH